MKEFKDFKDFLAYKFAIGYGGLDDEMVDVFENWIQGLDPEEFIVYADEYAKVCNPF